ncbi:hypothetical protein HOLleu_24537 [Holothuria leucospilota]|uniref:Tyrosine-protein kinase ephrin type A/B receptor-like domain-containing protein n=1 Tax=Holothuria leucospilota TaxID=206669 RepID=A0A9Q1BWD9_HOLLE|nr:hypothetical protein HOLleu_24537 [Holothuria leucospilota]
MKWTERDLPPSFTLFILIFTRQYVGFSSCTNISNITLSAITLNGIYGLSRSCVKSEFPPRVILNVKLKESVRLTLIEDGFSCTVKASTTECRPCRPGTIGDRINGCIPCPRGDNFTIFSGYYQDDFGRLECKKCKNGTYVRYNGSKSLQECEVCPGGTDLLRFAGHRACFCKEGYARSKLFGPCFPCLDNGLNCSDDYKFLITGYYWNWSFPGAKLDIYKSFVMQLINDSRSHNDTTYEYPYRIPKVYKCPREASCVNRDSFRAEEIIGNCEEGYRGWLCTKCQSRFYSILNICLPCPRVVWIIIETICIICVCVALYVFILLQSKKDKNNQPQERSLYDKISSQLKIVLGFYQVVGELFESLHDVNWTGPLQFVGEIISLMKVNILRAIIRPHCYYEKFKINVKAQLIIGLCFPITLIILLLFCYNMWKIYLKYRLCNYIDRRIDKLQKLKERILTYALLLLFITYPPTCDVIFKLYPGACKTFYLYDNDTTVNITLLRSDFDLDCKTLKSYQLLAYIATGVYVLSFPCLLLILLCKYCKRGAMFAFTEKISEDSEQQPQSTLDKDGIVNKNGFNHSIPVWIKFLCENYRPQFWYWEIIELARKVTQTVLVTLLGWEDPLTKMLTIGISVLFLTLHAKLSPMTSRFEQRLQMFSLTAIFINVLIASVPTPESYQALLSTFLVIMNMVMILVIAGKVRYALLSVDVINVK